jgi:hypothetical protein
MEVVMIINDLCLDEGPDYFLSSSMIPLPAPPLIIIALYAKRTEGARRVRSLG